MNNIGEKSEIVKPPGAKIAQELPEPVVSCNRARCFLAQLKGCKKIDHPTLVRLVRGGLPKHMDPFGSGRWCFLESEIAAWWNARMAEGQSKPVPGPGRPRKQVA